MKNNEQNIDLIEKYLSGELNQNEIKNFNEKLKSDDEFSTFFNFRIKIKELWLQTQNYEEVKQMVGNIAEEKSKSRIKLIRIIKVAASIALLIGIYQFAGNRHKYKIDESINDPLTTLRQVKTPENKSNRYVYSPSEKSEESLQLLSPLKDTVLNKNNPVVFKWETTRTDSSIIFIYKGKEVIKNEKLLLSEKLYHIPPNSLTPGKYYWKFEGTKNRGSFSIQ